MEKQTDWRLPSHRVSLTACPDPFSARHELSTFTEGDTLADALRLAPILEQHGADYLHVSAGVYGSKQLTIPSMYVPHGCFIHLAEAVKQAVAIPVIGVGRIKDPRLADQLIAAGKAGKRRFGYSRDKRFDCVQVVIALIVTPEGFPLAYEVMPGNTRHYVAKAHLEKSVS